MLETVMKKALGEKNTHLAMTAGGMLALLGGRKLAAIGLFGKGLAGLEREWRKAHPEFQGGLVDRWQEAIRFYEATHQNPQNRTLHVVGIPMIVGGAAGLILFPAYRPLWGLSAASFTVGWALNFVGHGLFEKAAPAFADDPLSFLAGPVWDFRQLFGEQQESPFGAEGVPQDAMVH
jgi:hypothetical protein